MPYGTRMLARSERLGRNRKPGFTPMPNARLNKAMQGEFVRLTIIEMSAGRHRDTAELQRRAVQNVARTLPSAPMVKSYRHRPVKNDDAAYRGIGGAGPRRQAAGL